MTREEYRQKYGIDPIVSSSTLDIKPAPVRMTRAEYDAIYGVKAPQQSGLGSQLMNRAGDVGDALIADKPSDLVPGRSQLRVAGAVAGAANDMIGAAISPVFNKVIDSISNNSLVQKFAGSKVGSKALDVTNSAVEGVQDKWKGFEEANPNAAQDLRDIGNVAQFIPVGKGVGIAKDKAMAPVKAALDERVITKRVEDLFDIENGYNKTRKANEFSKDSGNASRARIAETDVLVNSVDENGVIRTKTPGGAIDQYKAQTLDGYENIVKKNLEANKETVSLADVRKSLIAEIGRAGLEGGDLVTALRGVEREIAGLRLRSAQSDLIELAKVHDAKISTTKNINYATPPETATYRKAVARAYKLVVEKNSTKFDVEPVNRELQKYLDDVKRLERLDGMRVEGGRLGKHFAQVVGTGIGMAAGAAGGAVGSAVGGALGGGAAGFIKGKAMASSFGRATGKTAPKNPVLQRAKLSIPDKKLVAPKGMKKTKEITKLEDDIAKNVEAQKKAIKAGDFTLVATLKEIYAVLVDTLKKEVKDYLKRNPLISSQKKAIKPPTIAQSISETVPPTPKQATTPKGITENPTREGLEQIKQKIALREDSLNEFPYSSAKKLMKFYKNGDFSLAELNRMNAGKNNKSSTLDQLMSELGFEDLAEAQKAVDDYIKVRDTIAEMKKDYRKIREEVRRGEDILAYDTPAYTAKEE